jgi:hypothetical protein
MILERLLEYAAPRYPSIRQVLDDTWEQIKLVVHNHHRFEVNNEVTPPAATELERLAGDEALLRTLLLTVAFMYADINATPDYASLWPLVQAKLRLLTTALDYSIDPKLHSVMCALADGFPNGVD